MLPPTLVPSAFADKQVGGTAIPTPAPRHHREDLPHEASGTSLAQVAVTFGLDSDKLSCVAQRRPQEREPCLTVGSLEDSIVYDDTFSWESSDNDSEEPATSFQVALQADWHPYLDDSTESRPSELQAAETMAFALEGHFESDGAISCSFDHEDGALALGGKGQVQSEGAVSRASEPQVAETMMFAKEGQVQRKGVASRADGHQVAVTLAPAREWQVKREGELSATIRCFKAAIVYNGTRSRASGLLRAPFIQAIEAFGAALNKLGPRLGWPLVMNARKLRNSCATAAADDDYVKWLLSEDAAHKSTSYKSYADESAWMANLWIGRSMDFFVELFALIRDGGETTPSAETAYAKTLQAHHTFVQRQLFYQVCKRLPCRHKALEMWKGDGTVEDVLRELSSFMRHARVLGTSCLQVNGVLEARLRKERVKCNRAELCIQNRSSILHLFCTPRPKPPELVSFVALNKQTSMTFNRSASLLSRR